MQPSRAVRRAIERGGRSSVVTLRTVGVKTGPHFGRKRRASSDREVAIAYDRWTGSVEPQERLGPVPCDPFVARCRAQLKALDRELARINMERAAVVQALRAHGFTWAQVGAVFGVSAQACQQRWGPQR